MNKRKNQQHDDDDEMKQRKVKATKKLLPHTQQHTKLHTFHVAWKDHALFLCLFIFSFYCISQSKWFSPRLLFIRSVFANESISFHIKSKMMSHLLFVSSSIWYFLLAGFASIALKNSHFFLLLLPSSSSPFCAFFLLVHFFFMMQLWYTYILDDQTVHRTATRITQT